MDFEGYEEIIKNINKYKIRTTKQMGAEYLKLYKKMQDHNGKRSYDSDKIRSLIKFTDVYLSNSNVIPYPDYSWILNTFKWKLFEKLKIPKSVKKIYSKIRSL